MITNQTKLNDRIIATLFIILFMAAMYSAYLIKEPFSPDPLGTRAFPYIINSIGIISSLFLFFSPEKYTVNLSKKYIARFIATLFLLLFYAATFESIGFIISTTVVAFCVSLFFGGSKTKSIIYAILLAVISFLVFKYLLELNIPIGNIIQNFIDNIQTEA